MFKFDIINNFMYNADMDIELINALKKFSLGNHADEKLKIIISRYLNLYEESNKKISRIKLDKINHIKSIIEHNSSAQLLDKLSIEELTKLINLSKPISYFENLKILIKDMEHKINALYCIINNYDRCKVLELILKFDWSEQHIIMTYWAWIKAQQSEKNRDKFEKLYECKVGSRINRQTIDREFYSLLHFLPSYFDLSSNKFLFLKKSETPDFIIENIESYKQIGIEITEAPISVKHCENEKNKEKVLKLISDKLINTQYKIQILKEAKWFEILKNEKLLNEVLDCAKLYDPLRYSGIISELDLRLLIYKDCQGSFSILQHISADDNVEVITKYIIEAINNKLNKIKNYKHTPKLIYNDILLIYLNFHLFNTNFNKISSDINKTINFDKLQPCYKEIYVLNDKKAYKIH